MSTGMILHIEVNKTEYYLQEKLYGIINVWSKHGKFLFSLENWQAAKEYFDKLAAQ